MLTRDCLRKLIFKMYAEFQSHICSSLMHRLHFRVHDAVLTMCTAGHQDLASCCEQHLLARGALSVQCLLKLCSRESICKGCEFHLMDQKTKEAVMLQ